MCLVSSAYRTHNLIDTAPVVESVVPPHSTTRLLGKTKSSSKLTQAEIESVSVDVERIIGM